jgi:hypothetical protein
MRDLNARIFGRRPNRQPISALYLKTRRRSSHAEIASLL